MTFDQFRQDQNVYLHHEEHKDAQSLKIEDGLTINQRPDWTAVKDEFGIYEQIQKLAAGTTGGTATKVSPGGEDIRAPVVLGCAERQSGRQGLQ